MALEMSVTLERACGEEWRAPRQNLRSGAARQFKTPRKLTYALPMKPQTPPKIVLGADARPWASPSMLGGANVVTELGALCTPLATASRSSPSGWIVP